MRKRIGILITLIGIAGIIGGYISCQHFNDGDNATDVSRVSAEHTSFLIMVFGEMLVAIGIYTRDEI